MIRPRKVGAKISLYKSDDEQKLYVVKNLQTGEFFLFNEKSLFLWNLMDGNRTKNDIIQEYKKRYGQIDIEEFENFLKMLKQSKLIGENFIHHYPRKYGLLRRLLLVRIPLLKNTKKFVSFVNKYILGSPLRTAISKVALLILSIAGLNVIISNYNIIFVKPQIEYYTNSAILNLILFLAFVIPMSWVHEISHAIMCVHFGIEPGEIGIMFFNFIPTFYVDVSDSWLCSKKERIYITLAGPLSNLSLGFMIALAWYFLLPQDRLLPTFIYFCILSFILNLNPLLPFDGYYVLQDLLEIPELRSEFISQLLDHKSSKAKIKPIAIYGLISFIWSIYILTMTFSWMPRLFVESISLMKGLVEGEVIKSYLNMSRLFALLYLATVSLILLVSSVRKLYAMYFSPLIRKLYSNLRDKKVSNTEKPTYSSEHVEGRK